MLTDAQKRRYARHILLDQLGATGQQRLCAARVATAPGCDERAAAVARDYLARAGVEIDARPTGSAGAASRQVHDVQDVHHVHAGSTEALVRLAGHPALVDCAAWLSGAFAAVETMKQIVGAGAQARLDPELVLNAEVI